MCVCVYGKQRAGHTLYVCVCGCVFERTLQLALRALFVVCLSGSPLSQLGRWKERDRKIKRGRGERERRKKRERAYYK